MPDVTLHIPTHNRYLCQVSMLGLHGLILMLWGFLDESGIHDATGRLTRLTMGGAWAYQPAWEALSFEWCAVLEAYGIEMFHMADFEARRIAAWDDSRRKKLLNSLLDIIIAHIEDFGGFTYGIEPKQRGVKKTLKLLAERHFLDGSRKNQEYSVVFADHQEHSIFNLQAARDAVDVIAARAKSVSVISPLHCAPLQVADLIAYEISRFERPEIRPMRYPMKRLTERAQSFWHSR